jgi:hypothetical protein
MPLHSRMRPATGDHVHRVCWVQHQGLTPLYGACVIDLAVTERNRHRNLSAPLAERAGNVAKRFLHVALDPGST